jgi:hypothetical protein
MKWTSLISSSVPMVLYALSAGARDGSGVLPILLWYLVNRPPQRITIKMSVGVMLHLGQLSMGSIDHPSFGGQI